MTDQQLAFLPDPPPTRQPTPRQAVVLQALTSAGHEGLDPQAAGAIVHAHQGRHPPDRPCAWCKAAGTEILKALRKKGLARKRNKPWPRWVAAGTPELRDDGFGELPEGF